MYVYMCAPNVLDILISTNSRVIFYGVMSWYCVFVSHYIQVLRTLQMLKSYQIVTGGDNFSSKTWLEFLYSDLRTEILKLAGSSSVSHALSLWARHKVCSLPYANYSVQYLCYTTHQIDLWNA